MKRPWLPEEDSLLLYLRQQNKSYKEIQKEFEKQGFSRTVQALKKRASRLTSSNKIETDTEKSVIEYFRTFHRLSDAAKDLSVSLEDLERLFHLIQQKGYQVHRTEDNFVCIYKGEERLDEVKRTIKIDTPELVIGILSDTHLVSKYAAIEELYEFYENLKKEGAQLALHAGDLFDGDGTVYKGQKYELRVLGIDAHLHYTLNNYPFSDIPHFIISGNHDETYYTNSGIDMVKRFIQKRKEFHFLGVHRGMLEILYHDQPFTIMLQHGKGSLSYALSYKLQTYIRELNRHEKNINLFVLGHYHRLVYIPNYGGIHAIMPGCFQYQTKFTTRLCGSPDIGGVILRIKWKNNRWCAKFQVIGFD